MYLEDDLNKINILVVGDIMLDKYIIGEVNRISPEAPVPIVKVTKEYSTLGGSGNVIRNLREIGVNVSTVALVGEDAVGKEIKQQLKTLNVDYSLTTLKHYTSVQKTRIISGCRNIQLLRIDKEETGYVAAWSQKFKECLKRIEKPFDIIIVSDYAKGSINGQILKELGNLGPRIIVDPKPINDALYKMNGGLFIITPNKKEFDTMVPIMYSQYILETRGNEGMILYNPFKNERYEIKGKKVDVYNVSGAGDTVISIIAICTSLGIDVLKSAKIANDCAQYVVTQPGTSVVPKSFFEKICRKHNVERN